MTAEFVLGLNRELAFVPMFRRAAGTLIEATFMLPAIFGPRELIVSLRQNGCEPRKYLLGVEG